MVWHRVFSTSPAEVPPHVLASHMTAEPHFKGDDLGWTGGQLRFPDGTTIELERYLTSEDDLRADLNAHAAGLEATGDPNATALMAHVIQTQQLVTLQGTGEKIEEACRVLAAASEGVYQIDGRGWFAADGTLLVAEG